MLMKVFGNKKMNNSAVYGITYAGFGDAFLRQRNAGGIKNWECAYERVTRNFTDFWCETLFRNVELAGRKGN
jgi:hypothetical protein